MDEMATVSSPSISSASSSDLDTQSTGSFFPDRSTTLGSLMGLPPPHQLAAIAISPPPPSSAAFTVEAAAAADAVGGKGKTDRMRRRRRSKRRVSGWWWLCREDHNDSTVGPMSLAEFLKYDETGSAHVEAGRLFENGRVLPPAPLPSPDRRGDRRISTMCGVFS